ncbi:MAG: DUF371 domain-containing protein, partial [Candidatus Hermodarchaeota archaeon]
MLWIRGQFIENQERTLEITKDAHLTDRGDCIVAVKADKACLDLSKEFKEAAR